MKRPNYHFISAILAATVFVFLSSHNLCAQTSAFTYQGKLKVSGSPANATFDMQFQLFDAESGGSPVATTQTIQNVQTANGIFTVQLDFGPAAFGGAHRWIEISISPSGQGTFVTLLPRQQVNAAPYSIQALSASLSTNALNLGGVPAEQYVLTGDARLSDARVPLPGSNDYVQNNANTSQSGVSFNVGGTGSADILNAQSYFSLGGTRMLSSPGEGNIFVGRSAGASNTSGGGNSFFGRNAGGNNTTGYQNSFFGNFAGVSNITGTDNSFFGDSAGQTNGTGSLNSFFGSSSGVSNSIGRGNSFFGQQSGHSNISGFDNSFFGRLAGINNISGNHNTFVGYFARFLNGNGDGDMNSLLGAYSVATDEISFATAIGAYAAVSASDTIVLGKRAGTYDGVSRPADTVEIPGFLKVNGTEGVKVFGSVPGNANLAYINFHTGDGTQTGYVGDGATGDSNIFLTSLSGSVELITNAGRVLTADPAGTISMLGGPATHLKGAAQVFDNPGPGFRGVYTQNLILTSLDTSLASPVHICARIEALGQNFGGYNLTRCTSTFSSAEGKADIQPFSGGLEIVRRLNPVSFKWKKGAGGDIGLNAEDVASVAPALIVPDEGGGVGEVNENGLSMVLVNAIKEQQKQIDAQADKINSQQRQIDALKIVVCQIKPQVPACNQ